MRIAFTIPRKPVGVNDAYRRAAFSDRRGAHGGSGMIMTREGKEFVAAARMYALVAARAARWPTNLATVERVAIEVRAFNSDLDVDSPLKLTLDAFEGVLYGKDKVVRRLFVEPDDDGGVQRLEVVVEILPPKPLSAEAQAARKVRRSASAQKGVETRRRRQLLTKGSTT